MKQFKTKQKHSLQRQSRKTNEMADVEELATETDKRLSIHEAICAQRYEGIQGRFDDGSKRMTKIEYLLYGVIVCVLFGPGVAGELIKKVLGL